MVNKQYVAIIVIAVFLIIGILSAYLLVSGASKTPVTSNNMNMGNSGDMGDNGNISNNSDACGNETTVTIQNGSFEPSNLTVKTGASVTWISKDSDVKHMVTGNGFMSPHLSNGQSFSYTFNQTGTYNYYDMDNMDNKKLTGTIIVQ